MQQQQHHGGALRRRGAAAAHGQGNAAAADDEERPPADSNSNSCCICHEPWASSGRHRICCIPCGHVYGRSCLELWLARSGGAAAKCLWCEKRFRRRDMINLYGATEHLLDHQHQQVATEDEEEEEEAEEEEEEEAAAEQQVLAAPGEQQQAAVVAPVQAAIMDAIARMNMNNHQAGVAAAAGGGAVAWKGVEVAWRIELPAAAVAPGNDEAAVARHPVMRLLAVLLFVVCVVLCFIF